MNYILVCICQKRLDFLPSFPLTFSSPTDFQIHGLLLHLFTSQEMKIFSLQEFITKFFPSPGGTDTHLTVFPVQGQELAWSDSFSILITKHDSVFIN